MKNGFAFVYEDSVIEKPMDLLSKGYSWGCKFVTDMTSHTKHEKVDGCRSQQGIG